MKPSQVLESNYVALMELLSRSKVRNARLFGSTLHGTDMDGSDLDLLVDAPPGTTLLDLSQLQLDLEDLLGIAVDLRTPADLSPVFREQVLAQAIPL